MQFKIISLSNNQKQRKSFRTYLVQETINMKWLSKVLMEQQEQLGLLIQPQTIKLLNQKTIQTVGKAKGIQSMGKLLESSLKTNLLETTLCIIRTDLKQLELLVIIWELLLQLLSGFTTINKIKMEFNQPKLN